METLIMSIKPKYAQAILDGTKTIEIRRGKIRTEPGTARAIIIYETAPTKKFVGTVQIAGYAHNTPADIKPLAMSRNACTETEYDEYTNGAKIVTGLLLRSPYRYPTPITPPENWRPPQSYYRTTIHECRALIKTRPLAI